MNLVQIKHTGSLKAYVPNFNAQMIITPQMDELSKKYIFPDGPHQYVVDAFFKYPELPKDVAGIIKIVEQLKQMDMREGLVPLLNKWIENKCSSRQEGKEVWFQSTIKRLKWKWVFQLEEHQKENPSNVGDKKDEGKHNCCHGCTKVAFHCKVLQ